VVTTMRTEDLSSWKWRQCRHVFWDTFFPRALPPVI
jgi:hypothetical protein